MQHALPALSLRMPAPTRRVQIAVALGIVYFVWGSTYYAMKVGLETFSPFLLAAPRFLVAGGAMYLYLRARGAPSPTHREWVDSAKVGTLLLVCGNGGVALAQRTVDTSVSAIVVATMPIWAALFSALSSRRPTLREGTGLAFGFVGILVLHAGGSLHLDATSASLVLAPMGWALGSVLSTRMTLPAGPMATAAQMLTAGVIMFAIAVVRGERLDAVPSGRSLLALIYLAVIGSIVALSAYNWLLRNVRPAVATSYAFVNPLVALGLGVVLAHERVSWTTALAIALSLGGVAVMLRGRRGVGREA